MARTIEPKFHEELAFFMPAQTKEERDVLRQSIIEHGILDPIIVSEEKGWILDGYNRFDIAKQLRIGYRTAVVSCPTLDDAKIFMIKKQIGKRNLNPEKMSLYRGELYNRTKASRGGERAICHSDSLPPSTAEALAEKFDVSPSTIVRDGQYAAAVNALPAEEKAAVLSGKSGKTKKQVIQEAQPLCKRCVRVGAMVVGCTDCLELAKAKRAEAKRKKKKPKAGNVKFDFAKAEKDIGVVVRIPDAIIRGYPEEKGKPWFNELMNRIGSVVDLFSSVKKSITKSGVNDG